MKDKEGGTESFQDLRQEHSLYLICLTADSGVSQSYNTTPKKNQLFGRDHQTVYFSEILLII